MVRKKSYTVYSYGINPNKMSKDYKSRKQAIDAARKLADKDFRPVELNLIERHPQAKTGEVDFSQRFEAFVLPSAFKQMSNKAKIKKIF